MRTLDLGKLDVHLRLLGSLGDQRLVDLFVQRE
jgi:hypothetical protein